MPGEHLLRRIDRALDLSWLRAELAPFCSSTGRLSIDPELMTRMLLVGCCYGEQPERLVGEPAPAKALSLSDPASAWTSKGARHRPASPTG